MNLITRAASKDTNAKTKITQVYIIWLRFHHGNISFEHINYIHLKIIFCQSRNTGLPAIETITFWSVHDDFGVECVVLCAAQPTQK